MSRSWFRALARKLLSGRCFQRKSRPIKRSASVGLEGLEQREVMSGIAIEPSSFVATAPEVRVAAMNPAERESSTGDPRAVLSVHVEAVEPDTGALENLLDDLRQLGTPALPIPPNPSSI